MNVRSLFSCVFVVFSFLTVFAAGKEKATCENMAKNAAIRAYYSEVGVVQGSDGIQYKAKLEKVDGNVNEFIVSISDNNEDGEAWTIDYYVSTVDTAGKCKIRYLVKMDQDN